MGVCQSLAGLVLGDESEQLNRGEAEHSEHQMAHHLVWSSHAHVPAAVIVLQGGVDPFGAAALTVTDLLGGGMANMA